MHGWYCSAFCAQNSQIQGVRAGHPRAFDTFLRCVQGSMTTARGSRCACWLKHAYRCSALRCPTLRDSHRAYTSVRLRRLFRGSPTRLQLHRITPTVGAGRIRSPDSLMDGARLGRLFLRSASSLMGGDRQGRSCLRQENWASPGKTERSRQSYCFKGV